MPYQSLPGASFSVQPGVGIAESNPFNFALKPAPLEATVGSPFPRTGHKPSSESHPCVSGLASIAWSSLLSPQHTLVMTVYH